MPYIYVEKNDRKDNHKYIEITGFEGKVSELVVPEVVDGLGVEAIGNHAFSGRQDLVTVSLPKTIRTIYGFAFHNCRNLRKISLYDSVDDYYDGVIRQCDSLEEVEITLNRGWYEVVRNFLADNDKRLRFRLNICDDPMAASDDSQAPDCKYGPDISEIQAVLLTFPEYVYDFNENTMARTIQFSIAGSGMFYRECVDRRSINYREYDRLFEKAKIDGGEAAQDIAIGRLLYPVQLEDRCRQQYEDYVRENGDAILERLIQKAAEDSSVRDVIRSLVGYNTAELISHETIDRAIKLSSGAGLTEISAILMEYGRKSSINTDSEFIF